MSEPGYDQGGRRDREGASDAVERAVAERRSGMGQTPAGTAPPATVAADPDTERESSGNGDDSGGVLQSVRDAISGGDSQQSSGSEAAAPASPERRDTLAERLTAVERTQERILDRVGPTSTAEKVGVETGKGALGALGGMMVGNGGKAFGAALGSLVPGIGMGVGAVTGEAAGNVLGGSLGGALGGMYERRWEESTSLLNSLSRKVAARLRGGQGGEAERSNESEQRARNSYFK